jgi:hypothetical protein
MDQNRFSREWVPVSQQKIERRREVVRPSFEVLSPTLEMPSSGLAAVRHRSEKIRLARPSR